MTETNGGASVMDALGTGVTLIVAVLAVVAVLYLSYVFSRHLATSASKINKSANIKIIDRVALGQDRMLLIVKIGEKHYLIGSSAQSINILTEIDGRDIGGAASAPEAGMPFKDALKSVLAGNRKSS